MNNRVIKFRAWDKKNNYMLQNVGFQYSDVGMLIKPEIFMMFVGTEEERLSHYEGRYGRDYILMQYTGLEDTEENPIYEGDIVEDKDGYLSEVIFDVEHSRWTFSNTDCTGCYVRNVGVKVVGDVWQNPELLEKK